MNMSGQLHAPLVSPIESFQCPSKWGWMDPRQRASSAHPKDGEWTSDRELPVPIQMRVHGPQTESFQCSFQMRVDEPQTASSAHSIGWCKDVIQRASSALSAGGWMDPRERASSDHSVGGWKDPWERASTTRSKGGWVDHRERLDTVANTQISAPAGNCKQTFRLSNHYSDWATPVPKTYA